MNFGARARRWLAVLGLTAAIVPAAGAAGEPAEVDFAVVPQFGPEILFETWGPQVESPEAGPNELALESQEQRLQRDALARLPAEQRLLLRLRYEQDLTLAEAARLTRQPDLFRANRQIQAALAALAAHMEPEVPILTERLLDASV